MMRDTPETLINMIQATLKSGVVITIDKSGFIYLEGCKEPLLTGTLILRKLATTEEAKLINSLKIKN